MDRAACKGMDIDLFFPNSFVEMSDKTKETCGRCEVKNQCYVYAEKYYIDDGVFGGLTPRQRESRRTKTGRTSANFGKIA